ncbi:MAG: acyltransferase [Clostridia bacterium]|nr:acyltransferase [Clostridia bacterium]
MIKQIKNRLKYDWYVKIKKMDGMEYRIMQMRRRGIKIGENCKIYTKISAREASLISIGDRTTLSSNVEFCTHDNAISKAIPGKTDLMGRITIGSDCFIGMNSILIYGVTLGDNCIVGAGAVVTKSFPAGSVIAGNPARRICSIEEYAQKYQNQAYNYESIPMSERAVFFDAHPELMVKK